MTEPNLLLGLDAGQTVTKACVFDRDGREVGVGSARVTVSSPRPHWVERDMDEVWSATATAIRAALADAGVTGARIAAVGMVGHNDGLYLVDPSGAPVRPAITAMDTRGADVLAGWRGSEVWSKALQLTGQVPFAGSPSTLLAWLARHDPDVLERTRWILFCKDWLRYRLTGGIATDPTEASCAFTSARAQAYTEDVWELYGLPSLTDRLPPLRNCEDVVGEVLPAAAEQTGLRAGTPVVTGAHDVDGTALGTGVVRPGTLSLVAGTFSINQVVSEAVLVDERWQARTFLRRGRWLNMSTSPSSASNLDWWRELFGMSSDEADYAVLESEVGQVLDGPSSIIYHPFLYGSPYGEMASAGFIGLRGWHRRGDVARALLEGVVLGHRVHVDALRERFALDGVARLSGGAARSTVWSQMFADALGMPVEIPDSAETGARGGALLAGLGLGWYSSVEEAADTVVIGRRHLPDDARGAVLDEAYERFVEAAEALREFWKALPN